MDSSRLRRSYPRLRWSKPQTGLSVAETRGALLGLSVLGLLALALGLSALLHSVHPPIGGLLRESDVEIAEVLHDHVLGGQIH